jgi:alkylation response protein AidB-like acyl-CoA dehydrogenase
MNKELVTREPLEIAGELARRFAERETRHDDDGRYAADNIADAREAGLLTLAVPESEGGLGADLRLTTETLRILAHGSPSTALMLAMHTSILGHYLLDPSLVPAAHREYFLQQRSWAWREAAQGKIFAVANSEPGAGGDVMNSKAAISTVAGLTTINGLKTFASFGTNGDYYMAAARDQHDSVDFYLVENDRQSIRAESEWNALGMRSSESCVLRLLNAPVVGALAYPGMLRGENKRHWATLSFTAIFIGIAESLLDEVRGSSESMLQKTEAVELHLALQASRSFVRHLTSDEPAKPDSEYKQLVRDCKLFVTRTLARQASDVFIAQTGRAYQRSSSISRKLRDLLAGPALRPPVGVSFEEVWEGL